jgi:hypothetical protein
MRLLKQKGATLKYKTLFLFHFFIRHILYRHHKLLHCIYICKSPVLCNFSVFNNENINSRSGYHFIVGRIPIKVSLNIPFTVLNNITVLPVTAIALIVIFESGIALWKAWNISFTASTPLALVGIVFLVINKIRYS